MARKMGPLSAIRARKWGPRNFDRLPAISREITDNPSTSNATPCRTIIAADYPSDLG